MFMLCGFLVHVRDFHYLIFFFPFLLLLLSSDYKVIQYYFNLGVQVSTSLNEVDLNVGSKKEVEYFC